MFIVATALVACGGSAETGAAKGKILTIDADGLNKKLEAREAKPLVVDVREPHEYEAVHIDGALLAPLGQVEKDLEKVDKNREIVLVCRSGRRSGIAYERLEARGFTNLRNLTGGMIAWEKGGHPVAKKK